MSCWMLLSIHNDRMIVGINVVQSRLDFRGWGIQMLDEKPVSSRQGQWLKCRIICAGCNKCVSTDPSDQKAVQLEEMVWITVAIALGRWWWRYYGFEGALMCTCIRRWGPQITRLILYIRIKMHKVSTGTLRLVYLNIPMSSEGWVFIWWCFNVVHGAGEEAEEAASRCVRFKEIPCSIPKKKKKTGWFCERRKLLK